MTLVTDILDRAARQCSVTPPSNWVTDTTATVEGLRDHLYETVDDILERVDLPSPLTTTATLTGTGAGSYALPPGFKRLSRGPLAVYETSPVRRAVRPVSDDGQWSDMDNYRAFGGERFYRVTGYGGAHEIEVLPELETGAAVTVHYVPTAWLTDGAAVFSDAGQYTVLPRRLLECGIVWRYRERKGLDYGVKLNEYDALLARLVNDSRGRRAISMAPEAPGSIWDIPVPDSIPTA